MSDFKVLVKKVLDVFPAENSDNLEMVRIDGYNAIASRGSYTSGDMVVYIPEASLIPKWLGVKLGFWDEDSDKGKLNGSRGNRIKAIKLRGNLSQGLILPLNDDGLLEGENDQLKEVFCGDDVAEFLGIEKYVPEIPTSMNGALWTPPFGSTLKYDIENIKSHPNVIKDGEDVVFTEKIHGTWACFGMVGHDYIVTSKGHSGKGFAFQMGDVNKDNVYVKTFYELGIGKYLQTLRLLCGIPNVYILGEIYGVQDLKYDSSNKKGFRVFDIYMSHDNFQGDYMGYDDMIGQIGYMNNVFDGAHIGIVPELYRGPFSEGALRDHTDGRETVSGKEVNIREGLVVRPLKERRDDTIGRVLLKSVSEDYLLRKSSKATEYQ